ncbi:hypothetical protein GUITHDRAFT_155865 [Guillardia theta CCMP2712]|uniref:Uncharacterized protein n=1 Tax=Guillardia theta (strain CCMP2712) TaxID=905079 RepID=L1IDK1_GUITC|nr:hypothetical protein GUITHDRAFT_155865 [Guillardia theta CCMP2712]EKX33994.1 hypothetical protein GUITHDRAFT_155865 [Guillardia theta CCMP2712]|eukprot:XP_005820974.1 hypothetical protein GUITHDRAFT_155865 [Guillardia theta CCMP2712]
MDILSCAKQKYVSLELSVRGTCRSWSVMAFNVAVGEHINDAYYNRNRSTNVSTASSFPRMISV